MTWHEVELRGWRLTGSYRPADIKTPIIDIMSVKSLHFHPMNHAAIV